MRAIIVVTMLIVAAASVHVPTMSSTVRYIDMRTSVIEVVAMRIAGIDSKVPIA
jgi:hypothetical protein